MNSRIRWTLALVGLSCGAAQASIEWNALARRESSPNVASGLTEAYEARGITVYVSEAESIALTWLFPIGFGFVALSIFAAKKD